MSSVKRKAESDIGSSAVPTAAASSVKRPAFASAAQPDLPQVKREPDAEAAADSSSVKSETAAVDSVKKEEEEEEEEYRPGSHLDGLKRSDTEAEAEAVAAASTAAVE